MRFADPRMLWLLVMTLPLLVWFLVWAWRTKQRLIAQFVQSRLLAQLTVGVSRRRQQARLALLTTAVTGLLLALARPQYGFIWEQVHQRGLDIVVAIDTSRSMLATDVAPNRLERAKLAALDLLRQARTDRLGLVAFAGTAFLQCPLTMDDEAFRQSVNALQVGIIPQGGTALAAAIDTALTAFRQSQDNHKILILFTDGEDHDGGALEAAKRAAALGLQLFTVGVGTPAGEQLRVVDEHGVASFVKDDNGTVVLSRLNSDLLRKLAQVTGGAYLELRGAEPMKQLYDARLAPLPKQDLAEHLFQQYQERFQWPLGLAILLLVVEALLPERKRVPRTAAPPQAAPPTLGKLVALLAVGCFGVSAHASAGKALRDYQQGRFRDAAQEYQRLLRQSPDDPRLHYNTGAAAYRAGRFDQATNEFNAAILSPDPELLKRAYYNLGNTLYRVGEHTEDLNTRMTQWQQAIDQYESALKLDRADADAKFNRDLVAKKLEALRRQQQKKPQPNSNDSKGSQKPQQNKDDQSQKQPPRDASKQDQQKPQPSPSKQDQSQQQQQQQQNQGAKPPQPPDQSPQPQPKPEQANGGNQNQPTPPQDKAGDPARGAAAQLGQMTPEQARQLLEAAKAEEKPMIFVQPRDVNIPPRSFKDW